MLKGIQSLDNLASSGGHELDTQVLVKLEPRLRRIAEAADAGNGDAVERRKHWRDALIDTEGYETYIGLTLMRANMGGKSEVNIDSETPGTLAEMVVVAHTTIVRKEVLDLAFTILFGEAGAADREGIARKTGTIGIYKMTARGREVIGINDRLDANPVARALVIERALPQLEELRKAIKREVRIKNEAAKILDADAAARIEALEAERATIGAQIERFLADAARQPARAARPAAPTPRRESIEPTRQPVDLVTLREEPRRPRRRPEPTPAPNPPLEVEKAGFDWGNVWLIGWFVRRARANKKMN